MILRAGGLNLFWGESGTSLRISYNQWAMFPEQYNYFHLFFREIQRLYGSQVEKS